MPVAPGPGGSGAASRNGLVLALLLALAACSLVPVWIVPVLPLQDLPNHLLKIDILQRYLAGDPTVRATYALNLKPFSNYTCYVAVFLLAPLVGLMAAAKLFVSAYLIALPLGAYAWLRRVNPRNVVLALAAPPLAFNLYLLKGNLNFCAALAIYLLALAAFERRDPPPARRLAGFALWATALYFTHGLVFLALAVTTGCLTVMRPNTVTLGRMLGLAPGLVLFAAMSLWSAALPGGTSGFRPSFEGFADWRLIPDAIVWLFGDYHLALAGSAAAAWLLVIAAAVVVTVGAALREARHGTGLAALARGHAVLVAALVLAVLYLGAPAHLSDWGHLRARFVPLAGLTLLGALRLPAFRPARLVAAMLLVASTLAVQAHTAREFRRAGAEIEEYRRGGAAIEPGAALLPVYGGAEEWVRPNLHSWAYYEIARGGWSPYVHAYPAYHPIVYRRTPWAPDERLGAEALTDEVLQRAASCYDYLVMWAPDTALVARVQRYYQPVHRSPRLIVARNRTLRRVGPPAGTPACLAVTTPGGGGEDG